MNKERCDVEDPIAERLWFGLRERSVEERELAPREERTGDDGDLQPGHVPQDVFEGQVLGPAVLPVSDAILDAGMTPLAKLEGEEIDVVAESGHDPAASGPRHRPKQVARAPG